MVLKVGTSLKNGKYILHQELGVGGFGRTYKAINQILNQVVVIKTFKSVLTTKDYLAEIRKEFLNEAQRLVKCHHPNIVRFYEFFIEAEIPYIVMDYIAGETLDKIVFPESPLSESTAIEYIRQLGEALRVIHSNGLLHRDIKPQNLILDQESQQVVIIDFGIAREFNQGLVQTHTNLVSDGYAPIEQYLPKAPRTTATDIYGLAATLYTLVTAQIPTAAAIRNRVPLSSPQDIRPELSNQISEAIMQGMALEMEERPSSIDEWLNLLPQGDNNISSRSLKTVTLLDTESKPSNLPVFPQIKRLRTQIPLGLIIFVLLVWGSDYAWLRFQSFSSNEKIQRNSTDKLSPVDSPVVPAQKSEQITPKTIKSENSTPATNPVDFPVVPAQKSEQITPKTIKSAHSTPTTNPVDFPVIPAQQSEQIPPKTTKSAHSKPVPIIVDAPSVQVTPKTTKLGNSTPVPIIVDAPSVQVTSKTTKLGNSTPVPIIVDAPSVQVTSKTTKSAHSTPVPIIVDAPSVQVTPKTHNSSRSETNSHSSRIEIEYKPNKVQKIENRRIIIRREQITRIRK